MATNTRPRRVTPLDSRPRERDVRRFERTLLPAHARVPAELSFHRNGERTVEVLITDLSPAGLGVIATSRRPEDLPPLRRKVELTLPEGHVLEGIVVDRFGLEGQGCDIGRVGIELRAAGTTFEELKGRSSKQILDLRDGLHEVLPCFVDASLPLLSGVTRLEGALTSVSLECVSVNFPYIHPGLFLGLEVECVAILPEGEFRLVAEISDLVPARAGLAGVDVLLTFDTSPKRFLSAFAQTFVRQRMIQTKRKLQDELAQAGFLPE
jgi:hypothetical protein